MHFYRVYLLDAEDNSVGVRGFQAESDEAAKRQALLISKGHNWTLWMDGKLIAEKRSPSSVSRSSSKNRRSRPHSHRILFVDDNLEFLEPVAAALCAEGHIVRSTSRGSDLIRLTALLEPDIVITDVIMPEADILDTIPTLRASYPDLPIIAISGNPHLLTLASKKGATHVLSKPFPLERLSLLIRVTMQ